MPDYRPVPVFPMNADRGTPRIRPVYRLPAKATQEAGEAALRFLTRKRPYPNPTLRRVRLELHSEREGGAAVTGSLEVDVPWITPV